MITFLIPIFSIMGFSLLISKAFHTQFVNIIPVVTSSIIAILYISCIYCIYEATLLIYGLGILSLLYFIISERNFLEKLAKYKFEILIISSICLLYAFFIYGRHLTSWDDYTFWATATKELLLRGSFDNSETATSLMKMHAHYPRGGSVFHYYFMALSGFREDSALLAHFILHIIFLMPLANNKNPFVTPLLFSMVLMSVCLYTTGTRSLYNDSSIGLMFGSIFAIYMQEKNASYGLILTIPIMIALPMFREIGMFLAEFAAIILIYHHGKYNNKNYIIYIIMLIVPIFISLLLNHHFEATHDFFGRTKHSLSNITSLIENFHDPQKLLFFNFLKYLALSFIKEGAISIYVTYALAFYLISRYRKEEIKNLKYFTISLFIFFILFAIWRLYLYYFTLEFPFALKGHSLTRYLGSYMLAFALLSALFIKLAIANAEPFPKRLKAILVFIFLVSIITIIINALRVSRNYNEYEKAINDTTSNILTMLEKDMPIDFDYSGKKGNFWCFYINYKLAPYNKEEELQKCLNYDSANAKIPDINQKKTGGIIYQPFLSKIISDEL